MVSGLPAQQEGAVCGLHMEGQGNLGWQICFLPGLLGTRPWAETPTSSTLQALPASPTRPGGGTKGTSKMTWAEATTSFMVASVCVPVLAVFNPGDPQRVNSIYMKQP